METVTFRTQDNMFEITVKAEFLTIVDPAKANTHQLLTEHKLGTYLHNPQGPALKHLKKDYEEYWLEGKKVQDQETINKIKHSVKFASDMEDLLKK